MQAIIKNALSLQRRDSGKSQENIREGLSLDDIESIVSDVGIDSAYIRQAAMDLFVAGRSARINRFLGGILQPTEVNEVPQALNEDYLKRILLRLPSITGDEGTGQVV